MKCMFMLLGFAALVAATPVEAQLYGVPYLSPGRPNTAGRATFYVLLGATTYGSAGTRFSAAALADYLLLSRLTLTAGAGLTSPAEDMVLQGMTRASFTILKADCGDFLPALAVTLGHGRFLTGSFDQMQTFIALPIDAHINLQGAFVEPFIAPRYEWRSVETDQGNVSTSGAGGSIGVRAGFMVGPAGVAAFDRSTVEATTQSWALGYIKRTNDVKRRYEPECTGN